MIGSPTRERYWQLGLLLCLTMPAVLSAEEAPVLETAPAAEQRTMAGNDSREAYLVQQQPDRARWLGKGPDRFAIVDTPAARADAHGTVLVLADAGHSATQGYAGQLHEVLPARGWRVVSFALPPLPLPVYRDRPSLSPDSDQEGSDGSGSASSAEDSADPETRAKSTAGAVTIDLAESVAGKGAVQQFESQSASRLTAVLELVGQQQPAAVVVVGIGLGAAPLAQLVAAGDDAEAVPPQGARAMVWVQPRFRQSPVENDGLPAALETLEGWPLLDIADRQGYGRRESQRQADLRGLKGAARYRQDALVIMSGSDQAQLAYRIHNWAIRQLE